MVGPSRVCLHPWESLRATSAVVADLSEYVADDTAGPGKRVVLFLFLGNEWTNKRKLRSRKVEHGGVYEAGDVCFPNDLCIGGSGDLFSHGNIWLV